MHRRCVTWLVGLTTLIFLAQPEALATPRERNATARKPDKIESLPGQLDLGAARTRPPADAATAVNGATEDVIEREARRAARWTASELTERRGRRQYYRVGFHAALRGALDDSALGRWDLMQGERDGWRDRQARATGYELGEFDAGEAARENAERQVAAQFRDLSATPRFRPPHGLPAYRPEPPELEPVTLRQVLSDLPWEGFQPLRQRYSYLSAWSYDAWQLYRCGDYEEFYSASWGDPKRAFSFWVENRRRAARFQRLGNEQERALFRTVFSVEFRRSLADLFASELHAAYELGFADGWSYGAFVREEWSYRRGFRKGFSEAAAAASAEAFERSYAELHNAAYRAAFREWSENPKPEIGSVVIHDGNDDGIFEPGERILVEYELFNYGGGAGRFPLALDGSVLAASGQAWVELPRRGVLRERDRLTARISELTPRRTQTALRFSMADMAQPLSLLVSRPLEFAGSSIRTRRDNLNGEVTVEIAVRNRSRRLRGGTVALRTAALPGHLMRRELEIVGALGANVVTFGLSGLEPLGLISGAVTLELELQSDGVLHDRFVHRLSGTAGDLGSRDLIELLLRMSRDEHASPYEMATARELLMQRLRVDWRAAVRSSGNPYKKDLKTRGSRTALGDLVQTYQRERSGFKRPEVFGDLSSEITTLARELPGAHPLLRKYVRKLARRLP